MHKPKKSADLSLRISKLEINPIFARRVLLQHWQHTQLQHIRSQFKMQDYKERYLPALSLNSAGLGGGVLDTLGDMRSGIETTTSL